MPKKKWIRGNNKLYVNKGLPSVIMKRSRFKTRLIRLNLLILLVTKNKET